MNSLTLPLLLMVGPSSLALFIPGALQLLLLISVFYRGRFNLVLSPSFIAIALFGFFYCLVTTYGGIDVDFRGFKLLMNLILAGIISAKLAQIPAEDMAYKYSCLILCLSILAVIGLIVNSITDFHFTTSLPPREYHFNFFTTWISDDGYDSSGSTLGIFSKRLQSIFDEPGTYGIMAFPAFVYFLARGRVIIAVIVFGCVILSESLNSIALSLFYIIFWLFQSKGIWIRIIALLVFIALISISADFFISLYNIKMGIDAAYSGNSSAGVRQLEYTYLFENLSNLVFPFHDMGSINGALQPISASYVRWIVNAGILLSILLIVPIIELLFVCYSLLKKNCADSHFFIALVLSIFISGFQRASFLDNILYMTLFLYCISFSQLNFGSLKTVLHGKENFT